MVEGKSALGTAVTTGEEKFPRTDESEKEVAKEANKTFSGWNLDRCPRLFRLSNLSKCLIIADVSVQALNYLK